MSLGHSLEALHWKKYGEYVQWGCTYKIGMEWRILLFYLRYTSGILMHRVFSKMARKEKVIKLVGVNKDTLLGKTKSR